MGFYDEEWTDCYQVSWIQHYLGQLLVNRAFYRAADQDPVVLPELATQAFTFWNTYAGPIQSQDCTYDEVRVLCLFGTKQGYVLPITGANGSQGVSELPSFFAYGYRLQPADTRVRPGRKALGGIIEEMVDGNAVAAGYVGDFEDFASGLQSGLLVFGQTLQLALLSPGNSRHLGNIITPTIDVVGRGWTTQNSRKAGRGA